MMNKVIHKAETRGHASHGWLNTYHTFSFANYHDQNRVHFGALRVLNDDQIAAGMGFGQHPHDNMEIVTIPLKGAIKHKDTMGTEAVISAGDVQIMSAGSGLMHSEMNASATEALELFQIWVFPKERDIEPRYEQKTFDVKERSNKWQTVVSPNKEEGGVWINQEAWFSLADLDAQTTLTYTAHDPRNGLYLMVIEGAVETDGETLNRRDGMGIWSVATLDIKAIQAGTQLLVIEVPMY